MKHIFLTLPSGSRAGLTSASVGLIRSLDRNGINAGFYKPFNQSDDIGANDRSSFYLKEVSTLDPPPTMALETLQQKLETQTIDQILAEVVEVVDKLLIKHDTVVIEGLIATIDLPIAEKLNIGLASSLNAEVIIVKRPSSNKISDIKTSLDRAIRNMPADLKINRPAVILNQVPQDPDQMINLNNFSSTLDAFRDECNSQSYDLIGLVPDTPELQQIRMSDLAKEIDAEIIQAGNLEDRRVSSICLCARHVENVIHRFKKGTLLVAPADRSDIIIAAALAAQKGIELAGIILTCDLSPKDKIIEFCDPGFDQTAGLPILKVSTDSYLTAHKLANLDTQIAIDDHTRIDQVMTTVARFIDSDWLRKRISSNIQKRLSPVAFKHYLAGKSPHDQGCP